MQIGIGKIVREHGIKGDVLIIPYNPASGHFVSGMSAILNHSVLGSRKIILKNFKAYKEGFLVHFDFLKNPEEAKKWRGAEICIDRTEMKELEKGEYYIEDLLGFVVVRPDGKELGVIKRFDESGTRLLMVLENEILIPWVEEWIKTVDASGKKIVMDLPEGFEDL